MFSKRMNLIFRLLVILTIVACLPPAPVWAGERFVNNNDGTVTDTQTGLMWSAKDNGSDISYYDADSAVIESTLAGYSDWRLPDKKELAAIYDETRKNKQGFGITNEIKLSECCQWSSYDSLGTSSLLDFRSGRVDWMFKTDMQKLRFLMVRDVKELEGDKSKQMK